jgi:Flp pilus assembly protein TadB
MYKVRHSPVQNILQNSLISQRSPIAINIYKPHTHTHSQQQTESAYALMNGQLFTVPFAVAVAVVVVVVAVVVAVVVVVVAVVVVVVINTTAVMIIIGSSSIGTC